MYEPTPAEGIFIDYKSTEDLLYKEIYNQGPKGNCFVKVYHKGKFIDVAYVWGDIEMDEAEYIAINHTVIYLDTLKTLIAVPDLIKHICDIHEVTLAQLKEDCRKRIYSDPRNILFYLLREVYELTWQAIGDMFNRHHATAMNGHKQIKGQMDVSPKYKAYIESLIIIDVNNKQDE